MRVLLSRLTPELSRAVGVGLNDLLGRNARMERTMDTKKKWCSGLEQLGDSQTRCKHGHAGPGMQACKGIRYPHGTSLAPCEREDLPFCENRKCVRADMRPNYTLPTSHA